MTYTTELFLTGITDCVVIWVSVTAFFLRPNTGGIFARNIVRCLLFVCALAGIIGTGVHGFRSTTAAEPRMPFPAGFCLAVGLAFVGVPGLMALARRFERNIPQEREPV